MWIKNLDGGYVNLNHCAALEVWGKDTVWMVAAIPVPMSGRASAILFVSQQKSVVVEWLDRLVAGTLDTVELGDLSAEQG